jgi:transcription initiation factor IIF auxiliary subunit
MLSRSNISIVDTAIDPGADRKRDGAVEVRYQKAGERDLYKVWISLDGPDVPFVQSVAYELHPSFAQRVHRVSRTPANPSCALIIWTWGLFEVKATLRMNSGESAELTHRLTYDRDFSTKGVTFVQEPA